MVRPNGTSDHWQALFHFLPHADFAVFWTCSPKADGWCDATVCPFDLKITPEHCTSAICNISEAHPNRPSGRKVSWDIRGTFFVDTHGTLECGACSKLSCQWKIPNLLSRKPSVLVVLCKTMVFSLSTSQSSHVISAFSTDFAFAQPHVRERCTKSSHLPYERSLEFCWSPTEKM